MVDNTHQFMYVEPSLCLLDGDYSVTVDDLLMCSWIQFEGNLLKNFASVFIREIIVQFSLFVGSLFGLLIRITIKLKIELLIFLQFLS